MVLRCGYHRWPTLPLFIACVVLLMNHAIIGHASSASSYVRPLAVHEKDSLWHPGFRLVQLSDSQFQVVDEGYEYPATLEWLEVTNDDIIPSSSSFLETESVLKREDDRDAKRALRKDIESVGSSFLQVASSSFLSFREDPAAPAVDLSASVSNSPRKLQCSCRFLKDNNEVPTAPEATSSPLPSPTSPTPYSFRQATQPLPNLPSDMRPSPMGRDAVPSFPPPATPFQNPSMGMDNRGMGSSESVMAAMLSRALNSNPAPPSFNPSPIMPQWAPSPASSPSYPPAYPMDSNSQAAAMLESMRGGWGMGMGSMPPFASPPTPPAPASYPPSYGPYSSAGSSFPSPPEAVRALQRMLEMQQQGQRADMFNPMMPRPPMY